MDAAPDEPPLEYKTTAPSDWDRFAQRIIAIEEELFSGSSLRQDAGQLKFVFTDPEAVCVVALRGGELVGFVCGDDVKYYVEPGDEEHDAALESDRTVYVETIDVARSEQGRGVGKALFEAFVAEARRRGFRHVAGHWREGPSAALIRRRGGVVRVRFPDHGSTGETYEYTVLDI